MSILLDLRAVELLASRLCHDLVSPVGAVNNGVELLVEMGPDDEAERERLIARYARAEAEFESLGGYAVESQAAAIAAGAATPLGAEAAQIYGLFEGAGHGGEDFSAIIRMLRGQGGES